MAHDQPKCSNYSDESEALELFQSITIYAIRPQKSSVRSTGVVSRIADDDLTTAWSYQCDVVVSVAVVVAVGAFRR